MNYKLEDKEMERENGRHFPWKSGSEERVIWVTLPLRIGTMHQEFTFFIYQKSDMRVKQIGKLEKHMSLAKINAVGNYIFVSENELKNENREFSSICAE